MAKNDSVEWFKWVIGLLILVIMGLSGYFAHRLDIQETEIANLNRNNAAIVTVINMIIPSANLSFLVNLSVNMNIPTENISTAVHLLQTDPEQAKRYLAQDLHFTVDQVNSVMQPTSIQDKRNYR